MAFTELVPFTTPGSAQSTVQTIAAGAAHTLAPVFRTDGGKVQVYASLSDGKLLPLAQLSPTDKSWQLQGPLTYVVSVKNAGVQVSTGA